MLKAFRRGMKAWGHYLLALLCAATVLLSAVWTREQKAGEQADEALLDQSQRLAQAAEEAQPPSLLKPAAGPVVCPYSENPVFFGETGVWQTHRAVDFSASPGDKVCAMAAGTVMACGENEVTLDHGDGWTSRCRGLAKIAVSVGQRVRAGDALGTAGASVPFEGSARVCVSFYKDENPVTFGEAWTAGGR